MKAFLAIWLSYCATTSTFAAAVFNALAVLRTCRRFAALAWRCYGVAMIAVTAQFLAWCQASVAIWIAIVGICAFWLVVWWQSDSLQLFDCIVGLAMPAIFLSFIAFIALSTLPPLPPTFRVWSYVQCPVFLAVGITLMGCSQVALKGVGAVDFLQAAAVVKGAMGLAALLIALSLLGRSGTVFWALTILCFMVLQVAVSAQIAERSGPIEAPTVRLLAETWRPAWVVAALPMSVALLRTDFSPIVVMLVVWLAIASSVGQFRQTALLASGSTFVALAVYLMRWSSVLSLRMDMLRHPFSTLNSQLADNLWALALAGLAGRGLGAKPQFPLPATDSVTTWLCQLWGVPMLLALIGVVGVIGNTLFLKACKSSQPVVRVWYGSALAYISATSVLSLWPGGNIPPVGTAFPLLTGGGSNALICSAVLGGCILLAPAGDSDQPGLRWPNSGLRAVAIAAALSATWGLTGFVHAGVIARSETLASVFIDRSAASACRQAIMSGTVRAHGSSVIVVADQPIQGDPAARRKRVAELRKLQKQGVFYASHGQVFVNEDSLVRTDPSGFGDILRQVNKDVHGD